MRVESKQHLIQSIDDSWFLLWKSVDEIGLVQREHRIEIDGVESWPPSGLAGWAGNRAKNRGPMTRQFILSSRKHQCRTVLRTANVF